ncbi:TPA: hypothetical protein U3R04_001553 [Streptococcus agalactiae]|uniref:hypothetical protein n=1 Tax=Streptococcus agalactiae TaxID=1311 RepID=UPI0012928206|nr:hypothetical protein [Streptococcus agalactiae]MQP99863.1 hypothetical protein [Streptococcus agalactiae]HEN0272633.1 hypothetical protein [Streptococcus agalactiae]HEN0709472.1 hypothetical protein [Streptococcus agalactiae]
MSNNLEIVMDIDSLEIYDVIDNELKTDIDDAEEEISTRQDNVKTTSIKRSNYPKDLWTVQEGDVRHILSCKNKHGSYPYTQTARDGTWGKILQLKEDEALWLTLEFAPELLGVVI